MASKPYKPFTKAAMKIQRDLDKRAIDDVCALTDVLWACDIQAKDADRLKDTEWERIARYIKVTPPSFWVKQRVVTGLRLLEQKAKF